jgi:hypothetical protein
MATAPLDALEGRVLIEEAVTDSDVTETNVTETSVTVSDVREEAPKGGDAPVNTTTIVRTYCSL